MKLLLVLLFIITLLYRCSLIGQKDAIRNFIPGTYIRFSQHEYGTEYDTLVISLQNESANEFEIMRKWKYERILDGTKIAPEYKRVITSALFHSRDKLLQESQTGDVYTFDVNHKLLFKGTTKYQKI